MITENKLYYIHDPMCSWCWAYQPILMEVRKALDDRISIGNILGGLAPDTDVAMPLAMRNQIEAYWRRIEQEVGTTFNFDFWQKADVIPRRATYPACRAVIAAALQGCEDAMIEMIQKAYYTRAMNPSDETTLLQLANELALDLDRFEVDLKSEKVQQILERQVAFSRSLPIQGFPSWVLESEGKYYPIPLDYHSSKPTLECLLVKLPLPLGESWGDGTIL